MTTREASGRVPGDDVSLSFGLWPGRGAPVIALHGITAHYRNFVGVADRLAGRRPLLALDLRGRGNSDKPNGPYGMVQHARDVAAAMDGFGIDSAVVVGHSMGAFVTAALAAEFPDRVRGVVLVDGGPPLAPPPGIALSDVLDVTLAPQMARLRATFPTQDAYFDYWRALPHFAGGRWNDWLEQYLAYDLGGEAPALQPKASEAAVRADFLDSLDAEALRRRLAAIKTPAILLRASEGFAPGDPPLFPEVDGIDSPVIPDTTHYTIALGRRGATAVADAIVAIADACGA